jgi:hypothetical protein
MLQDRGFLVHGAHGWQLDLDRELPLPETVQGMIAARLDAPWSPSSSRRSKNPWPPQPRADDRRPAVAGHVA